MKLSPLRSVRAQLTLWNVLVLALVLLALGGVLQRIVTRNLQVSMEATLKEHAQRYITFWTNVPDDAFKTPPSKASQRSAPREPRPSPRVPQRRWQTPVVERAFDLEGIQGFPKFRGEGPWDRPAFERALRGGASFSTVRDGESTIRVYSAPLRRRSGALVGVVQVASSLQEIDQAVGNLNQALLTLVPVGLLAAWAGGMFLTGRVLHPLREVTRTAAGLGAQDLSQRLLVQGADEFSELATTFNGMLGRLEGSFERQRRFTADASHELRTPLTVIKSVASRFLARKDLPEDYRRGIERLDKAANTMERVVQDLLLLARSDTQQLVLLLGPTPLSSVLDDALTALPTEGPPSLQYSGCVPELLVWGDASHLTRLVSNLLDNALRHTPPEGTITLSARALEERVEITVEDTGIGIATEHLPRVTERFYRVDTARARAQGGTGLGLAICESIAQAHGGTLSIESALGQGTRVTVTLPRAHASDGGDARISYSGG